MTPIVPANSDAPLTRLRNAVPTAAAAPKPGGESAGQALGPAASVTLSDAAKAMLRQADAAREVASAITQTFDERIEARTDALASRLNEAFAAEGVPLDDAIALRLDASGKVVTDSPYKKKVDKIFENDPDLAKEFKDVAALNSMRAAQKALELYAAEKKAARNDDERGAAFDRYTARSIAIQERSGEMTLKEGKLGSAALDYVTSLTGPKASVPEKKVDAKASAASGADDIGADILRQYKGLPSAETWAAQARADNIGLIRSGLENPDKWVDTARRLDAGNVVRIRDDGSVPSDDEAFQQAVNLDLGRKIMDLEDGGRMDQAADLRAAIQNGTLRIQKSSEVPDLNLRYTTTHFADARGGGTRSDWHWNPTGAAKAALDDGRAMTVGGVDRGAFYLSW